jgi:hypothetical protein
MVSTTTSILAEFRRRSFQALFFSFGGNIIHHVKFYVMRSLLYLIAVILIIGWLLGFFVYSATGLIHILLVLAVVSILLSFIRRGEA